VPRGSGGTSTSSIGKARNIMLREVRPLVMQAVEAKIDSECESQADLSAFHIGPEKSIRLLRGKAWPDNGNTRRAFTDRKKFGNDQTMRLHCAGGELSLLI